MIYSTPSLLKAITMGNKKLVDVWDLLWHNEKEACLSFFSSKLEMLEKKDKLLGQGFDVYSNPPFKLPHDHPWIRKKE